MIEFFEHIPSYYRTGLLVAGLIMLWMLEGVIPRTRFRKGQRLRHAGTNLFFTLTTAIVNLAFAFAIIEAAQFTGSRQFGLLYLLSIPVWLHALLAIMMMDFLGAYLVHLVQHKVAWMWHFHKIHHIDNAIDATTALRHHPVESVFRVIALLIAIITMGIPVWMVMLYQTISAFMSQFNHANIKLPRWMDSWLSWIIVSPDMHKVHHSKRQVETDSNYANIFSFWDRLFGTFVKVPDVSTIEYGLDEYTAEKYEQVGPLLKAPWENNP
ncbi:sterol desaturase family protein [Chitinophaga skermanii]|nr:sterol desaturase family protein [Chitinophaga skermanii]